MAEKGGKGFSVFNGGKNSADLPKGKDDSSAKSKRGRKAKFNSDDSSEVLANLFSKSGGKADDKLTGKVDFGKGGKGDNVANGGKIPVKKAAAALQFNVEQELPKNAQCLMNCEAEQILQGIQEQMVVLSEDPTIKIPVSFDRGLQYAKSGCHYKDPKSVRRVLETLKKHGVSDGEMCLISNISPESVEEVFALVPSLKSKRNKLRDPLKEALNELATLKHST